MSLSMRPSSGWMPSCAKDQRVLHTPAGLKSSSVWSSLPTSLVPLKDVSWLLRRLPAPLLLHTGSAPCLAGANTLRREVVCLPGGVAFANRCEFLGNGIQWGQRSVSSVSVQMPLASRCRLSVRVRAHTKHGYDAAEAGYDPRPGTEWCVGRLHV
jgi:hypothetical protein